jgi:hypothetical protein
MIHPLTGLIAGSLSPEMARILPMLVDSLRLPIADAGTRP